MFEKIYELKESFLTKKNILIISIILVLVIIMIILIILINSSSNVEIKEDTIVAKEEPKEICRVDIKGYIVNSGLYELECDKCVNDVIKEAGGLKENADTSVINLSKKIKDGMVIVVYSNEEVADFTKVKQEETIKEEKCINVTVVNNDACIKKEERVDSDINISSNNNTSNNTPEENKIISINTATLEELMTLKGVGESKAKAIIEYRNQNGPFQAIEDIMNVTGIGEKMFEKIKDSITL